MSLSGPLYDARVCRTNELPEEMATADLVVASDILYESVRD